MPPAHCYCDYDMTFVAPPKVKLDEMQLSEATEQAQRLKEEHDLLLAYQDKIWRQAETQRQRESKQLEERVSLRRALLEQKVR